MVTEHAKHSYEPEDDDIDEADLEIWKPRSRDRKLSDAYLDFTDREEC